MADSVPPRRSTSFRSLSSREQAVFPLNVTDQFESGPRTSSARSSDTAKSSIDDARIPPEALRRRPSKPQNPLSLTEAIEAAIVAEVARAEANLDPSELLPETPGEWQDSSLAAQLFRRNHALMLSRRRSSLGRVSTSSNTNANYGATRPSAGDAATLLEGFVQDAAVITVDAPRHRYTLGDSTAPPDVESKGVMESSSFKELPEEFTSALNAAPQATLIHLVKIYHKILIDHGLEEEAKDITDMLSALEATGEEQLEIELTGLELLLKNGLLSYMKRIQPHLPPIPSQVIKFKDVNYTVTVELDPGYESIHTKALECAKGPFKRSEVQQVQLLKNVTGYVMPGTLTLVLGPPACGKTVIPTLLAGRDPRPGSIFQGLITYNGKNVKNVNYQRLAALVAPEDYHYPTLTVRETMEFARECSQHYKPKAFSNELKEIVGDALKAGQDPKLEVNIRMLGLKRVADKPVGSAMMPTLTKDEVHRVSVAEMVAGTYAVYVFDDLNSALDDGLTFDLLNAFRIFTRVRLTSVMATLIQPSPEIVELFDRIILLNQGVVVYQGPRQEAISHFEKLGYIKPPHVNIAEFLEEVTTPFGLQYLAPGYSRLDLTGFEIAYKKSDAFQDVLRVVDSPELLQEYWMQGVHPLGVAFVQNESERGNSMRTVASVDNEQGTLTAVSMNHTDVVRAGDELVATGPLYGQLEYLKINPSRFNSFIEKPLETVRFQFERPHKDWEEYEKNPQFQQNYVQNWNSEFYLLFKRELVVTSRDKLGLTIRAIQVLVLGLLMGFLFFRVERNPDQFNMGLFRGITFVTLLDMTLFSLGLLPGLFAERTIYYKQQGAHFYRPSTYLLAKICGSIPFSVAEATAWTAIVYFLTNLSLSEGGWHFWIFYLVIILAVLHGTALVRCLSALLPDAAAAGGLLGILVGIFILFAGFLLPRNVCPKYWIWAYYLDPLQWGITALLVNEFNSNSYKVLCRDVPDLTRIPQCVGQLDETIGHAFLNRLHFYTDTKWIGVAVAVMIGWILFWTGLNYVALARIRHKARLVVTPAGIANFRKYEEHIDPEVASSSKMAKLSLSAVPVTLSWHELSYNILVPAIREELNILRSVSGWVSPGEMVAVLGGKGSGKTTLLNCLAGRKVILGRISGQILVNAYPRVQAAFTRVTGFVDPIEGYQQYVTVKEVLEFTAALNLYQKTTREQRSKFVDEILELMELKRVANTLVKALGYNYLTLCETRRVIIAAELARNPSIIFVDEPFGRLDAVSSQQLVQAMKRVTDTGRSVVSAVQILSQRILGQFTSVQILKRRGEVVYFGPVGKDCEYIQAYFDSLTGTPVCPQRITVAHYVLDLIGDGSADRKAAKDYAFEYRTNDLALYNHIQLQRVKRSKGTLGPQIIDIKAGAPYLTTGRYILIGLLRYYWRNTPYSWGRIMSSIIQAILLGSVYFNIEYNTIQKMTVRSGSLFISTMLQAITNVNSVLPQFVVQRQNYVHQKARVQFNVFWYAISFSINEFLYLGVATLLNSIIFCLMVQLAVDSAADFFLYWIVVFCLILALTFLGLLIASFSVLPQVAGVVVTIVIGACTATSGVVIPKRILPPQGVWIYWINPLQYALNSLTSIAFYCDVGSAQCMNGGLNPACLNNPLACPQCECQRLRDANNIFAWTQIKFSRSLNPDRIGLDILALICLAIIFRTATVLIWRWREAKDNRKNGL